MGTGRVGSECEMHLNGGTFATPSFTEVPEAKDVNITAVKPKGDTSGRGDAFKSYRGGRPDIGATFKLVHRADNSNIDAFRAAFLAGTSILLAFLDGADDEAGAEGFHGSFEVVKFDRNEPDDDGVEYDVEVAPDNPAELEWYTVSS